LKLQYCNGAVLPANIEKWNKKTCFLLWESPGKAHNVMQKRYLFILLDNKGGHFELNKFWLW